MATLATLRAQDQAGLDVLPDHDAYFDVDDREFEAPSRTLSLPFSQRVDQIVGVDGLPAAEHTRRTWRFEERRVPAVRCVLRVREIRAWSAQRGLEEPGMLNWIEWDGERSRVTIHPVTGPEHVIDVDRLEVEVEITDHVDHHYRVRVGRLAGVESQRRAGLKRS
jgi:hypothetical protein